MYQVIDIQTRKVMGQYETRKQAHRRADNLDLKYGAIRYIIKFVEG